ncbi:hypothetical protein SESBI_36470 [Sesbania bispinosa]|nr:hypothetical protein SESBI_36470 [Sesbania bispinosa]
MGDVERMAASRLPKVELSATAMVWAATLFFGDEDNTTNSSSRCVKTLGVAR